MFFLNQQGKSSYKKLSLLSSRSQVDSCDFLLYSRENLDGECKTIKGTKCKSISPLRVKKVWDNTGAFFNKGCIQCSDYYNLLLFTLFENIINGWSDKTFKKMALIMLVVFFCLALKSPSHSESFASSRYFNTKPFPVQTMS